MNKMREADFIFWGKGFCLVIILCKMFIAACFYQYGIFWGISRVGVSVRQVLQVLFSLWVLQTAVFVFCRANVPEWRA